MERKLEEKVHFSYQVPKSGWNSTWNRAGHHTIVQTSLWSSLSSHGVTIQWPIHLVSGSKDHRIMYALIVMLTKLFIKERLFVEFSGCIL